MQLVVLFFIFIYVAYWGTLIHLICRKKNVPIPIYVSLLLLVLSSLIPDTFNGILFTLNISNNTPHILYFGLFPIVVFYIYTVNNLVKKKNYGIIVVLSLHVSYTFYTLISSNFDPTENNLPGFICLIITAGYAINHFYKLFKELNVPNLLRSPIFWISSNLLFYGAGTLVMELFEPLIVSRDLFFALWPIHQLVLIGYIFLLNKAIYVAAKFPSTLKE